jgi:hypothetical protein
MSNSSTSAKYKQKQNLHTFALFMKHGCFVKLLANKTFVSPIGLAACLLIDYVLTKYLSNLKL